MPIEGLTDNIRPTHLGMIRIGEKKQGQRGEYPAKLDHFIFDPADEANAPRILAKIKEVYGDKPKAIKVRFHSNNPLDVFDANYALWQASGCICKGNGREAIRLDDKYLQMRENNSGNATAPEDVIPDEELEVGTYTRVVCRTPELCPLAMSRGQHGKPACKRNGLLRVVLPEIPGLGVWLLATSSVNSISQLHSSIQVLYTAYHGQLAGKEATLVVYPKQVTIPETQKRSTAFVLNIMSEQSFNDLLAMVQRPALEGPGELFGLGEEHFEDDEEGEAPVGLDGDPGFRPMLEDDREVLHVLAESGFTETKKRALLASAQEQGKTREEFIAMLRAQMAPRGNQARPAAAAPATAPQQQEIPVTARPAAATRPATAAAGNGSKRRLF